MAEGCESLESTNENAGADPQEREDLQEIEDLVSQEPVHVPAGLQVRKAQAGTSWLDVLGCHFE